MLGDSSVTTWKKAVERLGKKVAAEELGLTLPKKPERLETRMIESLVHPHKGVGGKEEELTGTIDTDGVSVSFHFRGKSGKLEACRCAGERINGGTTKEEEEEHVSAGCDPGIIVFVYG